MTRTSIHWIDLILKVCLNIWRELTDAKYYEITNCFGERDCAAAPTRDLVEPGSRPCLLDYLI